MAAIRRAEHKLDQDSPNRSTSVPAPPVMIGRRIASVIVALAMTGCAGTAGTGLNNSTRTFTPVSAMQPSDWNDPAELERTWRAALVRVPRPGGRIPQDDDERSRRKRDFHSGTLAYRDLYARVCGGIWRGTYIRIDFLARNGYAVIARPASRGRSTPNHAIRRPSMVDSTGPLSDAAI